jgi:hypothetical protein
MKLQQLFQVENINQTNKNMFGKHPLFIVEKGKR